MAYNDNKLRLDNEDQAMLDEMAKYLKKTKSEVLRTALRNEYASFKSDLYYAQGANNDTK